MTTLNPARLRRGRRCPRLRRRVRGNACSDGVCRARRCPPASRPHGDLRRRPDRPRTRSAAGAADRQSDGRCRKHANGVGKSRVQRPRVCHRVAGGLGGVSAITVGEERESAPSRCGWTWVESGWCMPAGRRRRWQRSVTTGSATTAAGSVTTGSATTAAGSAAGVGSVVDACDGCVMVLLLLGHQGKELRAEGLDLAQ